MSLHVEFASRQAVKYRFVAETSSEAVLPRATLVAALPNGPLRVALTQDRHEYDIAVYVTPRSGSSVNAEINSNKDLRVTTADSAEATIEIRMQYKS